VILMVMVLLPSVNITSVSSTTKTLGELLLVPKDIHKSGVIAHSKTLKFYQKPNPVKVNGLVKILNKLPPLISNI
jgi:hypothetical protein